jgi:organic radical activating enzyme
MRYSGLGIIKPDVDAICKSIIDNAENFDDVLFLGGEPCLFLDELIECVVRIQAVTNLKCYVTTSVPKTCYDNQDKFFYLIKILDGINLSVQHYKEDVADLIRNTKSKFDRQAFYRSLPMKEKIRINLNIVKPHLYTKEDIMACLKHYDDMGYPEIKLSEIQHGKDFYVSFEKTFRLKLKSPYSHGCQTWVDMKQFIPEYKGRLLLKRSCFMCEQTLNASLMDGVKVLYKVIKRPKAGNYRVVYEDGRLTNGWI